MLNWIVSLVSLLDILLLVYRNSTDFCILTLHSATLLLSSSHFPVVLFRFPMYCHVISKSDSYTSLFLIWISFISFSSLISMSRTFNNMLHKSGKSEHPCLVPDLRGNAVSFSLLSVMLTVSLSCMLVAQSCLTLCDPMGCNPQGSSVHDIL